MFDIILFMAKRGIAFFGSNQTTGEDIHNGNFLGIVELLSKYDPVLNEPLSKVKDAQDKGIRIRHIIYQTTR